MVGIVYRRVDKQSRRGNSAPFSHRGKTCMYLSHKRGKIIRSRPLRVYDVPTILSRCDVRYDVVVSNDCARAEEKLTVARASVRSTSRSAGLRRRSV